MDNEYQKFEVLTKDNSIRKFKKQKRKFKK